MRPEIVPLTRSHLTEWYGEEGLGPTVKGIAALLDGKIIAVAGLALSRGRVVAFCDLKDEARPFKVTMHKVALALIGEAKQRHRRILAACDANEKTAPAWLRRLGFRPTETDGVWEWRTSG